MRKLWLKDLVGQYDIDIMVDVSLCGTSTDSDITTGNFRKLQKVYIDNIKGEDWLFWHWEKERMMICNDGLDFYDCGYSGVRLDNNQHTLEKLYLLVKDD